MAKNTSILLGDHFEKFINDEISSGRFSSANEVVRTALRLLELQEQKIKKFRAEIEIDEKSGMVSNFDPEAHLAHLHKSIMKNKYHISTKDIAIILFFF
ncbi:MAG TPA: type II toxin-antitoxin system ParD family antitoxin [Flavobacterium sp.]|jgi:antitoxin ParD1/3/4